MAITIDAHAAVRDLEAAGADPKLAEAIIGTISRSDADLATNADLAALEGRLTASAYQLAFAVIVANVAIMFGLLKLIVPT